MTRYKDSDPDRPAAAGRLVSAHDVVAELRRRLPSLPIKKAHKLLYLCQGHHLATFGVPLFGERIAAWDMGPVVERVWKAEREGWEVPAAVALDEAALNTVGYVISRYGALTGKDLEIMTHGEAPWRLADATRMPGGSAFIRPEWMIEYFRTDGAPDDGIDEPLDSAAVSAWLSKAPSAEPADNDAVDTRASLHRWATRGR
jgi:uncharacterized phage-associated protein